MNYFHLRLRLLTALIAGSLVLASTESQAKKLNVITATTDYLYSGGDSAK